jgi:hypothetical protein
VRRVGREDELETTDILPAAQRRARRAYKTHRGGCRLVYFAGGELRCDAADDVEGIEVGVILEGERRWEPARAGMRFVPSPTLKTLKLRSMVVLITESIRNGVAVGTSLVITLMPHVSSLRKFSWTQVGKRGDG